MRKLRPRTKKIIAMLLIALTINTTIFSSAVMPVQAASVPVNVFVEALLGIFGYTYGFGTSALGMENTSSEMFAEMQAAWHAGESFEVDGNLIPSLYDARNLISYVDESYEMVAEFNNGNDANSYLNTLNEKSYKASGTLASKTFLDSLYVAKNYMADVSVDVLQTELDAFWSSVTDDNAEIGNFGTMNMVFGAIMSGIAARSQADTANTWTNAIDTSIWNPMDLYYREYVYNDITWPIYYYNFFEADATVSGYTRDFIYDQYVYVIPYMSSTKSLAFASLSENVHTLNLKTYKGATLNDDYYYTSSEKSYGYFFNISTACYAPDFNYTTSSGYSDALIAYVAEYGWDFNYTDNAESMDAAVTDAMTSYSGRAVTKDTLVDLYEFLNTRAASVAGTESATTEIAATITEAATALPEAETDAGAGTSISLLQQMLNVLEGTVVSPLTDVKDSVEVIPGILGDVIEKMLTIPETLVKSLWEVLEEPLEGIKEATQSIAIEATNPWDEDNTERSSDSILLLNGFYLLILIIIKLLTIFWHCLQFIVAIFEIQPSTVFLPDDVIMGLDYLKTLEITGIGLSVYDFLMGLVYIMIVFSVIRVLRINIDRIHVPGHGIKKAG